MASDTDNPANAADDHRASVQSVEDFLEHLKCFQAHEGPSHISRILHQREDLQQAHDDLRTEHRLSKEKFERDIVTMRTNDEAARRNALRDYTEERDKLKSEKEKLVQENINLRKSLDEHTIGSVALESRNKTQSEQIDALRLDLQRSKDSITSAVQEVQASKRELNRLQQTERELRERINQRDLTETKLKNDVSKAQEEALAYKREKERFVKQTDQVKSYLSPSATESLSDLTIELDTVWRDFLQLARSTAEEDLPSSALEDPNLWDDVTKLAVGLPLPRSNSAGAKTARQLLILSAMADGLVRCIFTSTNLLPRGAGLDDILRSLAEKSSTQEFFARRVLLQIGSDQTSRNTMTGDVVDCIRKLIPRDTLDRFKSKLEALVERSAQTWVKFQRSKTHFEASCYLDGGNSSYWKILALSPANRKTLYDETHSAIEGSCIPVFPQVWAVDDVEDKCVIPGVAVLRSQLADIEQEFKAEKVAPKSTARRRITASQAGSRQVLYQSAPGVQANGFLGVR